MNRNLLAVTACAGLLVQGCSSRPRTFNPTLASVNSDQAAFDAAYADCNQLFVAGKLDRNGRVGSGAVGAAAGATVAVAGGAAATSAGLYAGAAVASATMVLLPFVAIGSAVGMAKVKRTRKEKAIKTAMSGCLHDRGYDVAGWVKAKKKRAAAPVVAAR
jgi:hypothetical protein